jgi:hypothetical protein
MCTPLACSDYYETSVPPRAHRSAADLSRPGLAARHPGRPRMVPTFTSCSIGQAAPSSTPAAPPHLRRRRSAWPPRRSTHPGRESASSQNGSRALHPGPYPPDLSRYYAYGASTTGSISLYPLALLAGPAPSGSAGASRHCRSCFPLRGAPRIRVLPASTRPLRRSSEEGLSPPLEHQAPRSALCVGSKPGTGVAATRYPSLPAKANALLHGAGDDELGRRLLRQRHRAGLRGEFAIGLVDDQDARHQVERPPRSGNETLCRTGCWRWR